MKRAIGVVAALVTALGVSATPASAIGIDILGGASWHSSIDVKIGEHYIKRPEWETKPFSDVSYYTWRIRWGGHEIEWIHDKMYLVTEHPDIDGFNISDGYNYLLVNAPEKWGNVEARLGLGVIVAHPEGTIDGHTIGSLGSPSWRIAGLGGQLAVGYRQPVWEGLSAMIETKVTTAFVRAEYPVNDEDDELQIVDINVPSTGYHFLIGAGYNF